MLVIIELWIEETTFKKDLIKIISNHNLNKQTMFITINASSASASLIRRGYEAAEGKRYKADENSC